VRSHSTIRRYLRAQIGHVTFRLFFWGRCNNSQPSRLAASNRLIARLDKTFERSPKAHHFVIAHSHGGNVALYALENEIVRERLSGIVCIATPFLEAKPRLMLPLTKILVAVLACSWILVPFTIALSIALVLGALYIHNLLTPPPPKSTFSGSEKLFELMRGRRRPPPQREPWVAPAVYTLIAYYLFKYGLPAGTMDA
jgi:hypothetical protein